MTDKFIPLPVVIQCAWSNEGHDMFDGPCSCGSWHHPEDWVIRLKTSKVRASDSEAVA